MGKARKKVLDLSLHESIDWIPVEQQLPDDDLTVLLFVRTERDPVWFGWHGGNYWAYADGTTVEDEVTHWAYPPKGPDMPF